MAFIQYLTFDGENLPLPDSYEVNLEDKEADSGGETEAGTIQRDVVRAGVVEISVSFSVTQVWLKKLTEYKTSKGTIQIRHDQELPLELIAEIATWCYGRYAK